MKLVIENAMEMEMEMEVEATAVRECLDYGRLEMVIQEQRVIAFQEKRLDAAVEELSKLDKELRSIVDYPKVQSNETAIMELCSEARVWKNLIKLFLFLSQRPDQSTQAVGAVVQLAVSYLKDIPDLFTIHEVTEIPDSVIYREGLQSLCWHFLSTHEIFSGRSDPRIDSLSSTELLSSRKSREAMDQEPTPQPLLTPDFEWRQSTPSSHQRGKVKELCPFVCREPLKRRAIHMRQPMRPVLQRLFNQPSAADVHDFLSELEQSCQQRFVERYNFNPVEEKPLPGRYEWSPQELPLSRATSVDSVAESSKYLPPTKWGT